MATISIIRTARVHIIWTETVNYLKNGVKYKHETMWNCSKQMDIFLHLASISSSAHYTFGIKAIISFD